MDSDGRAVHLKEGGDGQRGFYLFPPSRGEERRLQAQESCQDSYRKLLAKQQTRYALSHTHPNTPTPSQGEGNWREGKGWGRGIGGKGGEGGGCADAGARVVTQAA
jgi:hypothetical protein